MKKQLLALAIALVFFSFGVPAESAKTPPTVEGTWATSGTAFVKVDVKKLPAGATKYVELASINVNLPNVSLIDEQLTFGAATGGTGDFSDNLLGMSGTYTLKKSGSFTVDIDTWIANVQAELLVYAKDLDSAATITLNDANLNGKVDSLKKIEGNIDINFEIDLPTLNLKALVSIDANLKGKPAAQAALGASPKNAQSAAAFIFNKILLPAVSCSGK